jgi:hypothetical protein
MKTLILQFQKTYAPGVAVTMVLQAQEIAIGGIDVDPDQHRLPALKDFVVGADADAGKVLPAVV